MGSNGIGFVAKSGASVLPLYDKLPHGRHGLAPEAVRANQRARIFGATVELVNARGYATTTVQDIVTAANVSKRTFYDLFGNKEDCFLWVFDVIAGRAIRRVNEAYRAENEWSDQLRSGFAVFVQEVIDEPAAARLALVEALGAGPVLLKRMDSASAVFERMVRTSFDAAPDRVELPSIIAKGIVGGISRVVRQRLVEDRIDELPGIADELLAWTLTYKSPAARTIGACPIVVGAPRATLGPPRDDREALMQSAAQIAARHGYERLASDWVVRDAGVSVDVFDEHFPGGTRECFLAALDHLGTMLAATAVGQAQAVDGDWPARVHAGLRAILEEIARDSVFARLAFIEVFAAGPDGIAVRSQVMRRLSDLLLDEEMPVASREVVAEAIVGAVWQIAHQVVWKGTMRSLPALADIAAYIVLAPSLGGEQAAQHIRAAAAPPSPTG